LLLLNVTTKDGGSSSGCDVVACSTRGGDNPLPTKEELGEKIGGGNGDTVLSLLDLLT